MLAAGAATEVPGAEAGFAAIGAGAAEAVGACSAWAGAVAVAGAVGGSGVEPVPAVAEPVATGAIAVATLDTSGAAEAVAAAFEAELTVPAVAEPAASDPVLVAPPPVGLVDELAVVADGRTVAMADETEPGTAAALVPAGVDVCVDASGARADVEAWAGRENSSMTTKIPAAVNAACIAARAMRRATGCDMGSSTRREPGPPPTLRRRRQTTPTRT
jgi:hypothetical protein